MFNRKLSTLAVVAFLSLPVVAFASTSRLEGMLLPGDYTSDYTSIYSWPSTITGVGNLVYAELGNLNYSGDMAMGAVLPNLWEGRYGVWALHLRQTTPQMSQGDATSNPQPGAGGFDPNYNTNQSFELGWGKKSGKNSYGVTLSRSYNELTDELPGTTWTFKQQAAVNEQTGTNGDFGRNIFGFGVGLSHEMSENTTVDASVIWQTRTYENGHDGTNSFKFSDNGGSNYMLAIRAEHKCMPNVTVVPVFKYYAFDLSNKYQPTTGASQTTDNTAKGWQVGAAGNWTINSNDLFVLGATFAQNKLDQQQDIFGVASYANSYSYAAAAYNDTLTATETLSPQLFMALETQVNSWLTLRFGANKVAFRSVKIDGKSGFGANKQGDVLTLKDSPFGMAAGAGVKMGSLKFDAVLTGGFFNDPFGDLIQGSNSNANTNGPFTKVSATYSW